MAKGAGSPACARPVRLIRFRIPLIHPPVLHAKIHAMELTRSSGILLHPTSLPGRYGIGDLGPEAFKFVDFLQETGQSVWQVLPLGPTGYGDSPYQSFSSFAGNPLLISPDLLVADGLLTADDLGEVPDFPEDRVDFGSVIDYKQRLLRRAYDNFLGSGTTELREQFLRFAHQSAWWLDDYALFRALKDAHGGAEWTQWDRHLRDREDLALHFFRENHYEDLSRQRFVQFLFFRQWLGLAHYAAARGVRIIGDIPIFVAHDSADVWSNRHLFFLDEDGQPTEVAGVPPDYFSADGQLWGNPLYRWEVMQQDGYRWWMSRLRATLSLVDIVRLDHFRGFEKYWSVPAGEKTARNGCWVEGPGADFFETIARTLGSLPIIAEDLGLITAEVRELRLRFGLPGMQVLQFAFSPDPAADSLKPYSFTPDTVVYTGTHDNDTTLGWFTDTRSTASTLDRQQAEAEREFIRNYLGVDGREIHWDFIRLALSSVARLAIIPLQDILGLGSKARMNVPSRESDNWAWRMLSGQLTAEITARLAMMADIYGRNRGRSVAERSQSEQAALESGELKSS